MINLEFVWIKKNHEKNIFWTYFCSLYIEYIGMWIANKSVQFFWKLIWDNMNILRVKSIMNRDPSARMCNRIRVLRDQQIKLVHTASKSKFWVIYAIMKNFIRIGPNCVGSTRNQGRIIMKKQCPLINKPKNMN